MLNYSRLFYSSITIAISFNYTKNIASHDYVVIIQRQLWKVITANDKASVSGVSIEGQGKRNSVNYISGQSTASKIVD
jgi:hypothetical protein